MAYPQISARKMRYDLDGTVMGYNTTGFSLGLETQFSASTLTSFNQDALCGNILQGGPTHYSIFFQFAELKDIYYGLVTLSGDSTHSMSAQWSPDTTYGGDGTWNNISTGDWTSYNNNSDFQRFPVQLTTPVLGARGLRVQLNLGHSAWGSNYWCYLHNFQIYGNKHSGETPDDIVFYTDAACTTELSALIDWGDVPAGTTPTKTLYLKNTSASKTVNNLAITIGGPQSSDGTFSLDGGTTFVTTQTVATLAPGDVQTIIMKNNAPTSPPFGSRIFGLQATIGSWS